MGKKSKYKKVLNLTSIGMGQSVLIQKSGEAASQMIQAYKGVRYDSAGNEILHKGRSLEKIANYKRNPNYFEQNTKQQAGFSAELIEEARRNKENIFNNNDKRSRTTDGIGKTNDMVSDLVDIDKYGNIIEGSGTQLKFLGVTKKGKVTVVDKLVKEESWDRYESVVVPKDQYQAACEYADKMAKECREQAKKLKAMGNTEEAQKQLSRAKRYENARSRIRQSKVTTEEALAARNDPKKFTVKEVATDSFAAGVQSMKSSMVIAGVIAVAQNSAAVINGEKDAVDAAIDSIETTADAGAVAFATGTAGTVLKAVMHTSKSDIIRRLGTTNAPAMIVTGVVDITECLVQFAKGNLTALQLLERLGEKGVCAVASGIGATFGGTAAGALFGTGAIIAGGVAGGMASYFVCSVIYNKAIDILRDAKIAKDRREYIEAMCADAIENMRIYQQILTEYCQKELGIKQKAFDDFFAMVDKSICKNDINGFYRSFDGLEKVFGIDTGFDSFDEFDAFMSNDSTILSF